MYGVWPTDWFLYVFTQCDQLIIVAVHVMRRFVTAEYESACRSAFSIKPFQQVRPFRLVASAVLAGLGLVAGGVLVRAMALLFSPGVFVAALGLIALCAA